MLSNRMRLNLKKIKIAFENLKFLGHILTPDEILPDPTKVQAIQQLQPPKTLTELRSFLGMVNYLSQFVTSSAHVLKPLYDLTKGFKGKKKNSPVTMTKEAIDAIDSMKKLLADPSVGRAYFDPECALEICTDASGYAIGGIIYLATMGHSPFNVQTKRQTHFRSYESCCRSPVTVCQPRRLWR